jgi:hypothetical protein
MGTSRFLKTPTLSIVLQLTEVASGDGRAWEVHDIERNRGFRVTLGAGVPAKANDDIDRALGLAIERALVTPPEKVAGPLYDVSITSDDLKAARERRA